MQIIKCNNYDYMRHKLKLGCSAYICEGINGLFLIVLYKFTVIVKQFYKYKQVNYL